MNNMINKIEQIYIYVKILIFFVKNVIYKNLILLFFLIKID